jgi:hypothetical protein
MAVSSLIAIVLPWWLLIGGAITVTMPGPAVAVPKVGTGVVLGQVMRIHAPGLAWLPIPVERAALDESRRGFSASDEDAIDHAFTAYEWIRVSHDQAVRVITVDGEAIEVELLEGRHAGRCGWLQRRQLAS